MLKLETPSELPRSAAFGPRPGVDPLLPLAGQKRRSLTEMPHALEPPAKKQSKWTREENSRIIELRATNMKWEDISKRLPGRSAISCRLHYQNFLERKPEWDEDKKNKLARLYERFRQGMWEQVARELAMPWRAAEAMHWELGAHDMAARAGVQVFTTHTSAQNKPPQFIAAPGPPGPYYASGPPQSMPYGMHHPIPPPPPPPSYVPTPIDSAYRYSGSPWSAVPLSDSNPPPPPPPYGHMDHPGQDHSRDKGELATHADRLALGSWPAPAEPSDRYSDHANDYGAPRRGSASPGQWSDDENRRRKSPSAGYKPLPAMATEDRPQLPPLRVVAGLENIPRSQYPSPETGSRGQSMYWRPSPPVSRPPPLEHASRLLPLPHPSNRSSSHSRSQSPPARIG